MKYGSNQTRCLIRLRKHKCSSMMGVCCSKHLPAMLWIYVVIAYS
jgi:hypothetical protein